MEVGISMKKVLFMAINMNVGGMEKALLNMIEEMPRDQYDITILMLEEYGGFLEYIPKDVKIEYLKGYKDIKPELNNPPKQVAKGYIRQGRFLRAFNILLLHIITKILKDRSLYFKYILKNYKKRNKQYDIAIAYAGPNDFISYYIINKVNALKKFQWIHFDVSKIGFNKKYSEKIYKKFDRIFVVSEEAKKKLDKMIPSIKYKTYAFYNIISRSKVRELANTTNGFDDNFKGIRILTVGRLSEEKGQDLTVKVLDMLKKDGLDVRWYCIGEGPLKLKCEKLIHQYNLEKDYIFLGAKTNPYPYMKECDLYVQPSRHEGYCITLAEARCFNNPIVTTDFVGASEQIINGMTGVISEMSDIQLYLNIKKLILDKKLRNRIKANLESENKKRKLYNEINLDSIGG